MHKYRSKRLFVFAAKKIFHNSQIEHESLLSSLDCTSQGFRSFSLSFTKNEIFIMVCLHDVSFCQRISCHQCNKPFQYNLQTIIANILDILVRLLNMKCLRAFFLQMINISRKLSLRNNSHFALFRQLFEVSYRCCIKFASGQMPDTRHVLDFRCSLLTFKTSICLFIINIPVSSSIDLYQHCDPRLSVVGWLSFLKLLSQYNINCTLQT